MKGKFIVPLLVLLGAFPMSFISSYFNDAIAGLLGTIYAGIILASLIYWLEYRHKTKDRKREYNGYR